MRDNGILEQLARGTYRLTTLPDFSEPDLVLVSKRIPQGIICLISALAYYNITTQIPHFVYVAIPTKSRKPKLDYPPIRYFWYSEKVYRSGIEVIKIGESRPALQFKVIVSPNEWQKTKKKQSNNASSEKSEKYRKYFQGLIDDLRENHHFTSAKKGQPQSWYSFSSGNKKFLYGHSFAQGSRVRTEIYIDSKDLVNNKAFFDKLFEEKKEIEAEFGQTLEWERLGNKRACRVAVYRTGSIEDSSEELQKIKDWGIQNLLKLRAIFRKRG